MILKAAKVAFLALGVGLAASSAYFFLIWHQDNARLKAFAADMLGDGPVTDQEIDRLNHKIYGTQGFAKNQSYYLWKALGPTPIQILQQGGDCSNKSRLLAAILGEYGVHASLVMLAPCDDCGFKHTVVEARASDGPIVVDPVYDISFPKPDGGYYDLNDLQASPGILESRLTQLVDLRGPDDKIAYYHKSADGSHYGFPKTINLDKNVATRAAKAVLSLFVERPQLAYRPRFLEDPKLFLTLAAGVSSLLCFGLAFLLHRLGRRRRTGLAAW
jgi:hypothetical protein